MKNLTAYFVNRPLVVNLMIFFVIIAGIMSINFHSFEMYPSIDLGIVTITSYHPGASPQDIELSITIPIEDELMEVNGLKKIYSSSMEGMSVITIRIAPDVKDPKKVFADIQKAVDRANTKLPNDMLQAPLVEELSTKTIPVVEIHITGNVPELQLRKTADQIESGLRDIQGVSGIDKVGYRDREVKIYVNPEKLQHLGITYQEITSAIKTRNVRDSGGSLDSFIAEKKVLTVGQFSYPKEVSDVIIRQNGVGNFVRVRDIAQVILDYENWQEKSFIDGNLSILLLPKKKPSADSMKTSARIKEFVKNQQKNLPPGVKLEVVNDISRFIVDMLDVLIGNAIIGLILLFIVLLLFFHFRLAFWVSFGLPMAILMTLLIMPIFGMGINVITLMMLILLLGMMVDDAIVTGESIFAHHEKGYSPKEAAISGRAVVSGPVIVSTLTTILSFAPLAFLGGLEGKFMWSIPVMVAIVLLASMFECQFMLPCHLAHIEKRPKAKKWVSDIQSAYNVFILKLIKWRYLTIITFILMFITLIIIGASTLKFNLYPETDIDTFFIKIELPEGASFEYTTSKTLELEKTVRKEIPKADLLNISMKIGQHDTDMYGAVEGRNPAWALMTIYMRPQGQRKTNSNDIIASLRKKFKKNTDFRSLSVEPLSDTPVAGKPVELELIGNNPRRFELADIIVQYLKHAEGVTEVWTSYKPGKQIINLQLNHDILASRGLTTAEITKAVRVAFDGIIVDKLQTLDDEIRYRIQFKLQNQNKLDTLKNLIVVNNKGKPIPLRSFASLVSEPGEAAIKHYYGQRTITVYADIDRKIIDVHTMNKKLEDFILSKKLLNKFSHMRYHLGGELEQQQEAMGDIGFAFIVCVLSIFLVLVMLFNSLTQPFLIMIVIPFGLTGVIIGFTIQNIEMSMLALIGVLGLIGVLVNDSLVMIANLNRIKLDDSTSKNKVKHLDNKQIADGASERLRPIIITSVTTCAGLFPTAYGLAGANPFITPMVMAMFWGILFGTLVSLIFLPCLYAADQDISKYFSQLRKKD